MRTNDDMPPVTAEDGIKEWASVAWNDIQHARTDDALEEAKDLACCVEIDAERIGGNELVAQLPWHNRKGQES